MYGFFGFVLVSIAVVFVILMAKAFMSWKDEVENPEPKNRGLIIDNPEIADMLERQHKEKRCTQILSDRGVDLTPAALKKRRTEYRKMYREAVAAGDEEKEIEALNGLYQYGLLVVYCYGEFDNSSGVVGWEYEQAVIGFCDENPEPVLASLEYAKDGRIVDCICLSETDWKHFEKRWGKVDGEVDLRNLFSSYPGMHLKSASWTVSTR